MCGIIKSGMLLDTKQEGVVMSKLATLLRDARLAKGWSQKELAERSKVPLASINRYEDPEWEGVPSSRQNVLALGRELEIPQDVLLPALGFERRTSKDDDERSDRWAWVQELAENDPRFARIAELYKNSDDETRDSGLSLLEVHLNRPRMRLRRRPRP